MEMGFGLRLFGWNKLSGLDRVFGSGGREGLSIEFWTRMFIVGGG